MRYERLMLEILLLQVNRRELKGYVGFALQGEHLIAMTKELRFSQTLLIISSRLFLLGLSSNVCVDASS